MSLADTDSVNLAFEEFITKIVAEKSVIERTTTEAFLADGGLATVKFKNGELQNNLANKASALQQNADIEQQQKEEGTIKITKAGRKESLVMQ